MPTVLIAEDEDLLRAEMQRLLSLHWPEAQVVALAEDGAHALELWEAHKPQVAFLDIQMPGLTGLQVAQRISQATHVAETAIVFVTAYDQHALAAFEAGAVDYLLKPVKADRLEAVVQKLKKRLSAGAPDANAGLVALIAQLQQTQAPKKAGAQWVSASLGNTIKLVSVADIIYFQSDNKYTRIVTAEGEALVRKSLKELQDDIAQEHFQQIHRATVVNMHQVSQVVKDGSGKGVVRFKAIADSVDVSAAYMGVFKGS
jgi:DNA-binding LytR/AlgR family response regulator